MVMNPMVESVKSHLKQIQDQTSWLLALISTINIKNTNRNQARTKWVLPYTLGKKDYLKTHQHQKNLQVIFWGLRFPL